ncbi:hypothetical protein BASA81_005545 [Batrachochytrium salamandrivorans]|nr:hypothetical protein BASA81_005545 [Batrachochytrium salamandrivorans]
MGKPTISDKKKLASAKHKTKATSTTAISKQDFVEKIRQFVETRQFLYVFDLINSRTSLLKQIRDDFKSEAVFVFGKNKLMQIALGRSKEEELKPSLAKVSLKVAEANRGGGMVGLLFSNEPIPQSRLDEATTALGKDYAKSGFTCPSRVELKSGPIVGLPSSMLELLRDQLKLPVALNKGVIELQSDFVVCEEGDVLTVESARILKLFGVALSEFKIRLLHQYTMESAKLVQLVEDEEGDDDMEEED